MLTVFLLQKDSPASFSCAMFIFLFFLLQFVSAQRKCDGVNMYTDSEPQFHCFCNATYCDDVPPLGDFGDHQAVVYMSDRYGRRFDRYTVDRSSSVGEQASSSLTIIFPEEGRSIVNMNVDFKGQTMNGFGGAWTDATAHLASKLSPATRQNLIDTYYSKDWGERTRREDVAGIGYSLTRIPVASCDFSTRIYSYDDVEGDMELNHFALTPEDTIDRVPHILRAKEVADKDFRLLATPWSAPGWMKTSGKMKVGIFRSINSTVQGGASLKDSPNGGPMWQVWANYFVKYFRAYAEKGLKFWGVTPQNEPVITADPDWWYQVQQGGLAILVRLCSSLAK